MLIFDHNRRTIEIKSSIIFERYQYDLKFDYMKCKSQYEH